jgi:chromate transporter
MAQAQRREEASMNKQCVAQVSGAPSFSTALRVWAQIGLLSFGGPAAQIALMHRVLVEERNWLDERQYLSALSFCMLLPGPEAMQLATYSGWRLHSIKGGLAAGLLFVAPGAILVLVLSILYGAFGKAPLAEALFTGVKAAVLAIVLGALWSLAQRALEGWFDWLVAVAAFVAIYFLDLPFPLVVATAAIGGYLRATRLADGLVAKVPAPPVPFSQTARTFALWLAVWIGPLLAVAVIFGSHHVLAQLAWFFSKLAIVTFGGAYAVLAYMAQEAVEGYGWLAPGEMLDGLGLAETTPGPLILVTEFVGYIAALRFGGGGSILMGLLGVLVTLWATFVPCFLWIFVDLCGCSLHRMADRSATSGFRLALGHRSRRRCHPQPCSLVRAPCPLRGCNRAHIWCPPAIRAQPGNRKLGDALPGGFCSDIVRYSAPRHRHDAWHMLGFGAADVLSRSSLKPTLASEVEEGN